MILDFLLLADHAEHDGGKVNITGGGVTNVTADQAPFTVPELMLVGRLLVQPGDEADTHELGLRRIDPDGTAVEVTAGLMPEELFHARPTDPDEDHGINFLIRIGSEDFPEFGVYAYEFLLDGDVISSKRVLALEGETNEIQATSTILNPEAE